VVLLGDSQVDTRGPFDRMVELYLGDELSRARGRRVRVVSIAAPGWGQDQELLAVRADLARVAPRPSLVALWFTAPNDLWNNTFPTHLDRSKPTFWLDGDALRGPQLPWLAPCGRRWLRLLRLVDVVMGNPPCTQDDELEARMPAAWSPLDRRGDDEDLAAFMARTRNLDEKVARENLAHEELRSEKSHFAIGLTARSERRAYSIRLTRRLLDEIASTVRSSGADFVIFTADRLERWFPERPTRLRFRGESAELSLAAAERTVDETLAGFPTLRIALGRDYAISGVDSHLDDEGNRYVMRQLAAWIEARGR
jgi:hypothetical protein